MLLLTLLAMQTAKTFTGSINALPANRFLAKLSKLTGEDMVCTSDVATDVLVLRVKEAPLEQIKERIAIVTDAQWEKVGAKWILRRPPDVAKALQDQEILRQGEDIQNEYKAVREKLHAWDPTYVASLITTLATASEKLAGPDPRLQMEGSRDLMLQSRYSPAGRALVKLMCVMAPRELGSIGMGEQAIYSTEPTKMQRPLPKEAAQVLAEYNQEQKVWAEEIDRLKDLPRPYYITDARYGVSKDHAPAAKLFLNIRRTFGVSFGTTLKAVDKEGWIVGNAVNGVGAPPLPDKARHKNPQPFEVGEDARNYATALVALSSTSDKLYDGRERLPLLQEWAPRLADPTHLEPLGLFSGDTLLRLAEARNTNLIAMLPDQALGWYQPFSASRQLDPDQLLERVQLDCGVSVDEGWLTVKPHYPFRNRKDRLAREPLAQLAGTVLKNKRLKFDDAAAYAAQEPPGLLFISIDERLARLWVVAGEGSQGGELELLQRMVLRFYGSLNPVQRAALRQGQAVTVWQLDNVARRNFADYVFGWTWTGEGYFKDAVPVRADYPLGHITSEATEALPNGLPSNTVIEPKPATGELLEEIIRSNDDVDRTMMTPQIVAYEAINSNHPLSWLEGDSVRFRVGHSDDLQLTFRFGERWTSKVTLSDPIGDWSKELRYSELPEPTRRKIEEAYITEAAKRAGTVRKGIPPS